VRTRPSRSWYHAVHLFAATDRTMVSSPHVIPAQHFPAHARIVTKPEVATGSVPKNAAFAAPFDKLRAGYSKTREGVSRN
jgi:hypothetical protein